MEKYSSSRFVTDGGDPALKPFVKGQSKRAKQLKWVLLMKANNAICSVVFVGNVLCTVLSSIMKRLLFGQRESCESLKLEKSRFLFRLILAFLVAALIALAIEPVAHLKGWNNFLSAGLNANQTSEIRVRFHRVYASWLELRAESIVPLAQALCRFYIALFLIQSVDRTVLCFGCLWIKYKGIKPSGRGDPFRSDHSESPEYEYPMVLVQIPMCNEREDNPNLGLVQARWIFINKNENLLTQMQNVDRGFHFEVEQQVNGAILNFFGFNGTAGVWRIETLQDSGDWLERTTVEDMDIAVRAHLKGWKFIFLNDVKVLCELPESYEAYRKQQQRWHSGPCNLFRLCLPSIITSQINFWKKANLIFLFFLLRKLIVPFYSLTFLCVILPMATFIPEADLPVWVIYYWPLTMLILNILLDPRSTPFVVPYILFENTMSLSKFSAAMSGLLQMSSSREWIVTKKTGRFADSAEMNKTGKTCKGASDEEFTKLNNQKECPVELARTRKKTSKIYKKELAVAFLLLTAAVRSLLLARKLHFCFLFLQGIAFLIVGLGLIGEKEH
ncbi:hypothetical protein BT93_F2206 [Corymbia citriodora subsp. variegata]|nr:hypothetical protein BT93_F2206 [Corymbia citriodora subsp. variegata]